MILMLLLCGCAQTKNCAWVEPILVSKEDVFTDSTAKQILIHNETWEINK